MVDLRGELDLRWFEGIVIREVKIDNELATNEWSSFRTVNDDVPNHHILFSGVDCYTTDWRSVQVAKFLNRGTR